MTYEQELKEKLGIYIETAEQSLLTQMACVEVDRLRDELKKLRKEITTPTSRYSDEDRKLLTQFYGSVYPSVRSWYVYSEGERGYSSDKIAKEAFEWATYMLNDFNQLVKK